MRKSPKFVKFLILVTGFWLLVTGTALAQQTYPQLDISGFKKWEYKEVGVSPQKNYFAGLTHLGGFYPTFTGGPWQERLQLRILGQLSENLSVTYDLEQQPETPDRYDVKVKYYNNELTFGDFTANFSGNEFASASKSLNGVMLTAKDSWYDITAVPSAKLKSQTQKLTSRKGTNTKGPYSLGHGSIVEGSERIELNGNLLTRNVDYTIDYFEGKITFDRIITQADEFKYSYEYTNILDLFFPTLSKRDFFGFQSRFTIDPEEFGKPAPKAEPVIDAARETFPSAGTIESEIMEEEASGRYRLKNTPLVKFTEKLMFMGTELKKNEDYIIRYDQGQIKLLTRFLPSTEEALIVEYKFYQTSAETDAIVGIGSRGPYNLSHAHLAPQSERIEVDGKLFVRDLDYTIDYETGEIIFGVVIGPTSQIKAIYRYNIMAMPTVLPSKFPKELKIGTTYLKESAKKRDATVTSTLIESATGQGIEDNHYHLYLQNRPIVPTSEPGATFIVKLDGVELTPEVDYIIPESQLKATLAYINDPNDPSDGYDTGTIKFLTPEAMTATSEISVTYTYYKSVVGKYSGSGDGTFGPYFLRNIRNIVPGSETVQVWEQGTSIIKTYTRNSTFEPDDGFSINYDKDNPSITFNEALGTTKNFQVIYQYVPPRAFEGGEIAQSVYGFDGSFKIGEVFKIDTAYAKSEIDQVYVTETVYKNITGEASKTYDLGSPQNITEGSEKISVNDNLLNRDIDYYISYSKPGQINFYYITPTTQDAISVEYQYQRQPQEDDVLFGQDVKVDTAYRLGAETKLFGDVLTIGGNTKQIGFDFTPMGGMAIGLGSKYKEYKVNFKPEFHSFFTNYSYKENHNPIGTSRDRFLRSYDNSVSLGIDPNKKVKIDYGFRSYLTLDDRLPNSITHESDSRQVSHTLSLTPAEWKRGVLAFTQKYDLKKTISELDYTTDSKTYSETNIDYLHANTGLKITERVSVGFDYEQSEPKTKALRTTTAEVAEDSSHTRSIDTSYDFTVDLTPRFLQKWTARVSLLDHKAETLLKNYNPTKEVQTTKNETYHMDLTPFSALNTSLDHNRQEGSSVIVGGTNPKSERSSSDIRITPFSWLSGRWKWSQSESIPETGPEKKTTGKSNSYDANWNPISWSRFKLSSRYTLSDNIQTAPSGTMEGVETKTNAFSQSYNVNLIPHPNAPVTLGFARENYQNRNNHPIDTSRIETETENDTITAGITLTPTPLLTLSGNYNQKETKVIRDLRVSPGARTKTIIDAEITYQILSWGTLVYDYQDETNGGEIQAGSVAALNLKKTTETYSLNISIPVDNPVLSRFVFIASLKSVDYKNLANPSGDDDFVASLVTLEGSLNF